MAGTVEETGQTRALRIDWQQHVVYLGFLVIFVFFAVMLRDSGFLTVRNLSNIVLQTAPITIMAIGLVFVFRRRDRPVDRLDRRGFGALRGGGAHRVGADPGGAGRAGADLLVGAVQRRLVAYLRLPSFLVTLGTLGLFAGIARSLTDLRRSR